MINGNNIIACNYSPVDEESFKALDPSTGEHLEGEFQKADILMVNNALNAETAAFKVY